MPNSVSKGFGLALPLVAFIIDWEIVALENFFKTLESKRTCHKLVNPLYQ